MLWLTSSEGTHWLSHRSLPEPAQVERTTAPHNPQPAAPCPPLPHLHCEALGQQQGGEERDPSRQQDQDGARDPPHHRYGIWLQQERQIRGQQLVTA